MVITYFGRAMVLCGLCTVALGMGVDEKKGAAVTEVIMSGDVENSNSVEQFCRLLTERFGGFDALGNSNEKRAQEIAKYIADKGCTTFVTTRELHDQSGRLPLTMAVQYGRLCLMQAFILVGANVNEVDNSGRTSFHRAVMVTWDQALDVLPILELLIKYGANPCLVNDGGQTPAQLACCNHFEKAAAYLKKQEQCYKEAHKKEIEEAREVAVLNARLLEGSDDSDSDGKN